MLVKLVEFASHGFQETILIGITKNPDHRPPPTTAATTANVGILVIPDDDGNLILAYVVVTI